MNSIECWYCHRIFEYNGNKYRDVACEFCGVENSIYLPQEEKQDDSKLNPATTEEEWLTKEKAMIDYNDEKYQGKYVYLPLMGQTAEFDIEEISEVKSDNPKFNFSENVPVMINGEPGTDDEGEALFKKKDLGYHIECKLKNGKILSVTSMSAFIQVFKKNNIQDGEKVLIQHKDKGVWEVEKLNG